MKKQIKILSVAVLSASLLFTGCSKEDDEDNTPEVSASNFTATIAENPVMGQVIGTVSSSIKNASSQRFFFTPEHVGIAEHVNISSDGVITVSDPGFFDYEQVQSITGNSGVEIGNNNGELASASFTVTINITDVNETPPPAPLTVQQRLDTGETPAQIYASNNNMLDSLYGKTYVGGLIFYFDVGTSYGLVSAPNDQSVSLVWDFNTSSLVATNATSTAIGDGLANTTGIVSTLGTGSYAAQVCNDLTFASSSNWFLPTLDEIEQMYVKLHANGLGNFQNAKYWTSSELSANSAWFRDFAISTGQTAGTSTKTISYVVRAIRSF
jgi:hypothetical protein